MNNKCMFPSIKINIAGPDGNAYYIMGLIQTLLIEIGYNKDQIDEVINDMKSSDYEHLCNVAKKYVVLFED